MLLIKQKLLDVLNLGTLSRVPPKRILSVSEQTPRFRAGVYTLCGFD